MAEELQDVKEAVISFMEKSSQKGKKEVYPKAITKELKTQFAKPDIYKAIDELVMEEKIKYYSYGSTASLMLAADWDEKIAIQEAG